MSLSRTKYVMYSIAAALIAAGESFKASADNIPASAEADDDGVIDQTGTNTTPGASTATNATPPAFDSAGLPWDERIHSGSKSIKADGTWTKKKGATPPVITSVEAELRAKIANGGAPSAGVQLGGTSPAPTGLALPTPGALALPTPVTLSKYQQLCQFLAANTGPGKVADDAYVNGALAQHGLTLAALANDEANSEVWLTAFKQALTPAAA